MADLVLNKPFKDAVKQSFQNWSKDQIMVQLEEGIAASDCVIDLSLGTIRRESVTWIMTAWTHVQKMESSVLAGLESAGSLKVFEPGFQREAAKQQEKWSAKAPASSAAASAKSVEEPAPEDQISDSGPETEEDEVLPSSSDWDSDFDQPLDKKQMRRLDNIWKKEERLRSSTIAAATQRNLVEAEDSDTGEEDVESSEESDEGA